MESMIYKPLEEYEKKFKDLHLENTNRFFERLVQESKIDIEANRKTVQEYNEYRENIKKLKRKYNWLRFLRVIMCITLVLIPLVITKTTPKIKKLKEDIEFADKKIEELYNLANSQMLPLNRLFTDRDALGLIEETIPLLTFDASFTAKQELDMRINYDFVDQEDLEQSTLDVLAGRYNDNPFVFENRLVHTMGTETYHGYKTISWTETYRDSNGKLCTRRRSETLHATVTKPKPYYSEYVVLNYGAQGGPELSFSREASHLELKSEKEIERHVKRGERKIKRMTDKAIRKNQDFVSMSNSDFEVLFNALNRTEEVQYRTLFTPLAQTNMVELILSRSGYGDDFQFVKMKRMNRIATHHSQGRAMNLLPGQYVSYSYDIIRENFINKNTEFFKAVYFDFAPIWAIPIYQERPVHSLKPLPDYSQIYSSKECEALANAVDKKYVVHPQTKTLAILKSSYVKTKDKTDETCVTAYSYDIEKRVDVVSVRGGDGFYHNVSVPWDEYIPLEAQNYFYVAESGEAQNKQVVSRRNDLCMFHKN